MGIVQRDAERLVITVGESDKHDGRPLFERIIEAARDHQMAGATAYRGMMGFGAHRKIHSPKILTLAENLPIVVEIVDTPEKIASFLTILEPLLPHQVISVEKVRMVHFE
jgi:PII-like signaling protein